MQPLEHLGSLPESENEGFFMLLLASPGLNITFVADSLERKSYYRKET